jgi:Uma2 family endonuclease
MSAHSVPRLSPEEFLEFERAAETKHEYFNGEIVDIPGGSIAHCAIVSNVVAFLNAFLRKRPCLALSSDMRLGISTSRAYTYPDVMVVCGEPQCAPGPKDTVLNPILVIEVLSPSTESKDRGYKLRHYFQVESLKEYVLISQSEPSIETYRRTPDGKWQWSSADGLEASLDLESLDCRIPLAEIYAKITFPPADAQNP